MKTKLLLLLLLANFSFYAQTNLVSNGDFENWSSSSQPDSWGRFFNSLVYQDSDAQNGSSSTKMEITSGTLSFIFTTLSFPIAIETGKTYRVTAYQKLVSGSLTNVELALIDSDVWQTKITGSIDNTTSTTQWRKIEFDYEATADKNIGVMIYARGALNSQVLVDNVSVVELPSPYTIIPDINFENKLIALGIDSGTADGKVLTADIAAVTSLDVSRSSISDLTGIEGFVNLTNLECFRNQITSIDLSKNTKLTNLDTGNNLLTSLDLSANTLLQTINCQNNKLTSLDISNNLQLTNLTCSSNQITNLDVSAHTSLTGLAVNGNKLTSLNIDNNLALEALNCSGNQLTSINVSNNLALSFLWCGSNQLTALNIDSNTALEDLNCGNNKLTTLNVTNNTNLVYLVCHQNQITSINVSNNTLLDQLMVHYNELTSLDVSNNPDLTLLDCQYNKITSIDISKNPKVYEIACEFNNLNYLNLKNGNNANFDLYYSKFVGNPDLTCITVDDVANSNLNWSAIKDSQTTYSENCSTLSINDSVFNKAVIYPNPTKGDVHINNVSLNKATVYNSLGQLVKSFTLDTSNTENTINLSGLPKGIYYVYLINGDAASAKKIIVE